MIISDLDHLKECEDINIAGGFLDFGGGDSPTNNTNEANFDNVITSALGILAPATALNNIVVTQAIGSASASLL